METIELLTQVRERLFEKGWRKGTFGTADGPNCIVGAVREVASTSQFSKYYMDYCYHALAAINAVIDERAIPEFNDAEYTTFSDVIDVIDRAIKIEEAKC